MLKGSTNGNRYIARRLRETLDPGGGASAYLDPYGDDQPERWARFKERLGGLGVSGDEAAAVIAAAQRTFDLVGELGEEILAATQG